MMQRVTERIAQIVPHHVHVFVGDELLEILLRQLDLVLEEFERQSPLALPLFGTQAFVSLQVVLLQATCSGSERFWIGPPIASAEITEITTWRFRDEVQGFMPQRVFRVPVYSAGS